MAKEGKKRKKSKSGLLNSLKEYGEDTSKSFGSGILKGGASLIDLPVSAVSSIFRERDPEKGKFENIVAGYTPMNDLLAKFGLDYTPKTDMGRYVGAIGEFIPGGYIGKAPKAVKAIGAIAGGLGSEAAGDIVGKVS